jgi:hypothetical protein
MDPTGCPPYLATDSIFQRTSPVCGSSLIAYWVVTMLIAIIRSIGAYHRVKIWLKRRRIVDQRKKRLQTNQILGLPIPQVSSVFASIVYYIMFILPGLNIANVYNGIPFSLFSLAFLPAMMDFVLMLLKLVRLGKKIIPLSLQGDELAHLEKFDSLGMFMLFLQAFSLTGSSLVLIILSPVMPQHDYILGTCGWAFK